MPSGKIGLKGCDMNIIICGAGEVGAHAAEVLGGRGNNITVIDHCEQRLEAIEEAMDVRTLEGNGAHAAVLRDAGCHSADVFIAATADDEINLLSASIASGVGADHTIARVHHSAFYDQRGLDYIAHLGIDHLVCPEYATAEAIARTIRNPGALAVEQFACGQIEMQQLPVAPNCQALGKRLADIILPSAVRVASVERHGSAFMPGGETVIQVGDVVTIVGDVESFEGASKLFHSSKSRRKRVIIIGGTSVGVWLGRALRSRAFAVRLFEPDRDRAIELSEKLDWVTVLNADPTEPSVLEEEHAEQADALVALTNDDEHNILVAARAKSLGIAKAIAVVQRPTYLHLLEHVGIDRAFSPRDTAVDQIAQLLTHEPVRQRASLAEGVADIYEVVVSKNATEVIGKPLKISMKLQEKVLVAAIGRGPAVFVPGPEDAIAAGDTVVVIGPSGMGKTLRKLLVTGS